jgi:Hemerythrin HHE cation binding domain
MQDTRATRLMVPEVAAHLLAEHDECMHLVVRVEACLDRRPDVCGPWLPDLRAALHQLARALEAHFEREERGPLFRVLPVARPRFAERLERLEAQHARISVSLAAAIARATELRDAQLHDLRELNAQVQLLVADIRRHEAAENEILFAANWDEVGIGD